MMSSKTTFVSTLYLPRKASILYFLHSHISCPLVATNKLGLVIQILFYLLKPDRQ